MSATTVDLTANIPGADITYGEVLDIGHALLNWVVMVERLGHTSPASSLDYTKTVDSISGLIVRDFVAWTCGRHNTVPGDPSKRLLELVHSAGLERTLVDALDERLTARQEQQLGVGA